MLQDIILQHFLMKKISFKFLFMNFIKASIRELKHVVWPTKEDTTKYFLIVVITLLLFGIYLFIFSTIFSEGLLYLKNFVS